MHAETLYELIKGNPDWVAIDEGHFVPRHMPLTPDLIEKHLAGEQSVGVYLLKRDKCYCSCVDFDDHDGTFDAKGACKALVESLRACELPYAVERSQSGTGYHVWMFHGEWVSARLVRRVWKWLLEMSECDPRTEVFPRSDSTENLGNLIRLPGWGKSQFGRDPAEVEKAPESLLLAFVEKYDISLEDEDDSDAGVKSEPLDEESEVPRGIAALRAIDAEVADDYDTWIQVGMACKSCGEELFEHWVEWSSQSDKFDGEESCRRKWDSFPSESGRTLGTLYHLARTRGSWEEDEDDYADHPDQVEEFEFTTLGAAKAKARDRGPVTFVPFGITPLEDSIEGMSDQGLHIIGGLPGHGKTLLGFQALMQGAKQGRKGLFVSIEMSDVELADRRLRDPDNSVDDDVLIVEGVSLVKDVKKVCETAIKRHGVSMICVDYIQLMRSPKAGAKRLEMEDAAAMLKQIAREHNVIVIALSQLNREVDRRANTGSMPRISDLAEGSALERSADLILVVWYDCKSDPEVSTQLYTIYVLKRRNGKTVEPVVRTNIYPDRQIIGGEYGIC